MEPDRLPRKLVAILYADVAGYSRLTGEDEDATHRRLAEYLDRIAVTIECHGGRVMHYAGDAVLAMFEAVVDALSCAARVQSELEVCNEELPDECKVQFRIGVNLGDVIEDRGDIYGDGVNVAARLESLAEPGGLCISESVHTAVGNKLPFDYEYLGEQEVKNIAKPVKAYNARLKSDAELPKPRGALRKGKQMQRPVVAAVVVLLVLVGGTLTWLRPWETREEPASIERMAFPLPDKPSIAVLPFTNMSDDPKQEYFVDGITEDLITDLSKLSGLFVIARNSVFTYKGKPVKVQQVAEELGVRYLLEGSVRRAGGHVRINAQLIDATTGGHVWAERYDAALADVFALQAAVSQKIVAALAINLTDAEVAQQGRQDTADVHAYDAFLQGWAHYQLRTPAGFAKAVPFFEEAIRIDGSYARAHAALAAVYWDAVKNRWVESLGMPTFRAESRAEEHLQEAMKTPTTPAYALSSRMLASSGLYEEAVMEGRQALALDANDASAYAGVAYALVLAGAPAEATTLIQKAMRLDPHHPPTYLITFGRAQFGLERFEDAAAILERAAKRNPKNELAWIYLAAAYGHLGRIREGDAAMETLNDLRAYAGATAVNSAEISFAPRFGKSSERKRLLSGLSELPALKWPPLVARCKSEPSYELAVTTAKKFYDRGVPFIDVRNAHEWDGGHIPGAINLPFYDSPGETRLTEVTLLEIVNKNEEMVFYSNMGIRRPASACAKALAWGYEKPYTLSGGLAAWKEAGYPVEKGK